MASCCRNAPWKLYTSRLVSAWGDRMWMFSVGLFMVELSPGSLKWPAINGLTQALAVVLLGSSIGRWVDRTPRWTAGRISLALQNFLVISCAVCVGFTFYYRQTLITEANGWGMTGACSLIVILGTLASLASMASSIVVYNDWVAIMADGDSPLLASMNSTCRSIDLATNIIAPIAVGQIMYFLSHFIAAVVIATWNIISFFLEYILLWKIYLEFPKLAIKKTKQDKKETIQETEETIQESTPIKNDETDDSYGEAQNQKTELNCCATFIKTLGGFFKSWRIYLSHDVRNAGIGLACLYMTVLGFDSITAGYAYSQGVPESLLGILQAVGACVGLLGSLAFPLFVRCIGVERTGLYGFGLEVLCLTLCVGSVWSPGSPFDPSAVSHSVSLADTFTKSNVTGNFTSTHLNYETPESYTSVILLMSGIISARFGLWVADLTVNQVLQQVDDQIRGTIKGVQSSINMMFDTLKFLIVIACPWPETFGILVCISFAFICAGWAFYASYSLNKRGHLLPFHKITKAIPPEHIHQIGLEMKNKETAKGQSIQEEQELTPTTK